MFSPRNKKNLLHSFSQIISNLAFFRVLQEFERWKVTVKSARIWRQAIAILELWLAIPAGPFFAGPHEICLLTNASNLMGNVLSTRAIGQSASAADCKSAWVLAWKEIGLWMNKTRLRWRLNGPKMWMPWQILKKECSKFFFDVKTFRVKIVGRKNDILCEII